MAIKQGLIHHCLHRNMAVIIHSIYVFEILILSFEFYSEFGIFVILLFSSSKRPTTWRKKGLYSL